MIDEAILFYFFDSAVIVPGVSSHLRPTSPLKSALNPLKF